MTTINMTTVGADFTLIPLQEQALSAATTEESFAIDLRACKEQVLLLVDAKASAAPLSVTLHGGDYPGKMADTVYTVPAASRRLLSISSGETVCTDGTAKLTVSSTAALNTTGATVSVIGKCYVQAH